MASVPTAVEGPTAATLFSAGKDSTLAALALDPFFEVTLCTCTFGIEPVAERGRETAGALGFEHATVELDPAVAREAIERMDLDGYPRAGIQMVHEHALETVAGQETVEGREVGAVADGTRRDDRSPVIERPFARSLEDRHGIDYLRPLAGYGRRAVDDLADRSLVVETGPSETISAGDYETELRALMADEYGAATVKEVFPEHVQSRVRGRRDVD